MRLPETAIEAAAKAIYEDDGWKAPWERQERERDVYLKRAELALTAFCESMGFEVEYGGEAGSGGGWINFTSADDMAEHNRFAPLASSAYRLASAWRPVEGEDP